ncbi:TonB family protein [bacterium]|nr:TonB family protein [bacterium]
MTAAAASRRLLPGRLLRAVVLAVLVNLALIGVAALLTRERPLQMDMTEPVAVNLVTVAPPAPPAPEKVREVEKPPEREQPEFRPDQWRPEMSPPAPLAGPAVAIDLEGLNLDALDGAFVFDAADLDQPPRVVARIPPVYPYRARQREIEGHVRVRFLVSPEGQASQVQVLEAEPAGLFEESVLQIIPSWRFSPGLIDGQPVASWMATTVRFELRP